MAASAGIAAATKPKIPGAIDYGASTRKGIEGDLANLPALRQLEIAARLGTKVDTTTGQKVPIGGMVTQVFDPKAGTQTPRGNTGAWITIDPKEVQPGGKYAGFQTKQVNGIKGYENKKISADFTGIGDADLQAKAARDAAQTGLDISRQYGSQYIDEAKKQQELADPQGTQARKLLYQRIQDEINRQPERPVSELLDGQIGETLSSGSSLGSDSSELVKSALAKRIAMGDSPSADIVGALESGPEGDARAAMRRQQALSYIGSGTAPSDVAYRKSQQDMSNIGSFLSGQTPQAQFQQLSGAQQGSAPISRAPAAPQANPNAGAQGAANSLTAAGQQYQQAAQTPNPWFTGLGMAIKGVAAYNNGRQGTGFG